MTKASNLDEEGYAMGGMGGSVNVRTGTAKRNNFGNKKSGFCKFCKIRKPEFSDEKNLDLHYVESCQMLT